MEASDEEARTMEICSINCSTVWRWYGNAHLCTHCILFVVPFCINIPNSPHV